MPIVRVLCRRLPNGGGARARAAAYGGNTVEEGRLGFEAACMVAHGAAAACGRMRGQRWRVR
jgi:hypothetical protein